MKDLYRALVSFFRMKKYIASTLAILATALSAPVWAAEPPPAPLLQDLLKRPNSQILVFTPTQLGAGNTLNVTHVRMGDGSVRPGSAVQLLIYASTPNQQGQHEILYQDLHFLTKDGPGVLHFKPFGVDEGRTGIIAILIGLLQPAEGAPFRPNTLPLQDIVAAEINPDGTGNPLLLPAVQKVRTAAAR
jgi:hypothetical protein